TGLLAVRVTREAGDSAAARILRLVQEAEEKKAPAEQFITRFARYYTPAVVLAAAALALIPPLVITAFGAGSGMVDPGLFFTGPLFAEWLRRALVFLVVSCPCALVVSIPLSFFGGIGGASRRGILVKGGNYLDALTRAGTAVFDKTGTLTRGVFTVSRIFPAAGFTEESLLEAAALAESNSNHPIGLSIRKAAGGRGLDTETDGAIRSYSEIAGKGARLRMEDGRCFLAGSRALLEDGGVAVPEEPGPVTTGGTVVYAAADGVYAGQLVIADELKPDSPGAVAALKKAGLRTVMLSGDSPAAAAAAAAEAGIDEVYGGLLPWEKVDKLEELKREPRPGAGRRNTVIFVGDGINDAPVLAASDIGVAMGTLGSDAAIESADMVLMTDEPSRLADALGIASKTIAIVKQNIVFALGVKAALLVLGAAGIASLWMAVFGDVGVALIAVLNACRAMTGTARG
ncbi:MAG: heavy metal translocating P-type ATPase, partial [Treponema sp.]|nr:heavy metal translocating P-type ATPase [Treponema sp.]